ncbi:hypothetical protein PV04_03023 [Phialophora macrospora]|uniref:Uncharacterized protein n=1 Tax=Phialophora macrospora TaxID=1851006 RepID=A0A0D2E8Y8_9EURO|nr:hypothetical protein PV04_03023 [Phialophora macrospora]
MVRMTIAMRHVGDQPDTNTFIEKYVDIYRFEQLDEDSLQIQPSRQVPALTGLALSECLTDSLVITYHLREVYPSLIPAAHKTYIVQLLKDLYKIQYLSLSFTLGQNRAGHITAATEVRLSRPDISESHCHALGIQSQTCEFFYFCRVSTDRPPFA